MGRFWFQQIPTRAWQELLFPSFPALRSGDRLALAVTVDSPRMTGFAWAKEAFRWFFGAGL
jgi:hypothetical protein